MEKERQMALKEQEERMGAMLADLQMQKAKEVKQWPDFYVIYFDNLGQMVCGMPLLYS